MELHGAGCRRVHGLAIPIVGVCIVSILFKNMLLTGFGIFKLENRGHDDVTFRDSNWGILIKIKFLCY